MRERAREQRVREECAKERKVGDRDKKIER